MNNFLSQLPRMVTHRKKRIGRGLGSGRGAKSGRGTTRHQKARESIPLHFEGGQGRMVKKFPLLRGKGRNKPIKKDRYVLSIDTLNDLKDGDTVTVDLLIKKNLVDEKAKIVGVKILARGKLTRKLHVELPVSRSAAKAIEKAGGTIKP